MSVPLLCEVVRLYCGSGLSTELKGEGGADEILSLGSATAAARNPSKNELRPYRGPLRLRRRHRLGGVALRVIYSGGCSAQSHCCLPVRSALPARTWLGARHAPPATLLSIEASCERPWLEAAGAWVPRSRRSVLIARRFAIPPAPSPTAWVRKGGPTSSNFSSRAQENRSKRTIGSVIKRSAGDR